jgi:pimeloyl-ACP methyl ester carboxylesterase
MISSPFTIYFAHGQESGPWGAKIRRLADEAKALGHGVESPDYSDLKEPEPRVERLLGLHPETQAPLVLVGSSLGGWVSLKASEKLRPAGLFLLAPAVGLDVFSEASPPPHSGTCEIVQGWRDDIVPPEGVIHFAEQHRCTLHLLDSGHRLTDQLGRVVELFTQFLSNLNPFPDANDPRSAWEQEQEANFQRKTLENQRPPLPRF